MSQYPEIEPLQAASKGRLPYYGPAFAHTPEHDEIIYENDSASSVGTNDNDSLQGEPLIDLTHLNANTSTVDADFFPEVDAFDQARDDYSQDSSPTPPPSEEPRRGAKRGRGRGRGWGLGPGSQGGKVRSRAGTKGRPRGSRNKFIRGEGARGGGKGRRGQQALADPTPEFKTLQGRATTAFLEQRFQDALDFTRQAIQINPEIFASHSLLSEIYMQMGKPDESLQVLWSGAHTRRDTEVWWEVAERTRELAGDDEEKYRSQLMYCYSQITRLDPNDYEARVRRFALFKKQRHIGHALRECETMLRIRPCDPETLQTFAAMTLENQDPARGKKSYQKAINAYQIGNTQDALDDFTFSDLNVYLELFIGLEQWEEGIKELNRVARWLLGREDEDFWDLTSNDCEWDRDDIPRRLLVPDFESERYPIESYGLGLPDEIRAKLGIFRLKLGSSNYTEALHHFKMFGPSDDNLDPTVFDYPDVFRDIADALQLATLHKEALAFYEALLRMDPNVDSTFCKMVAISYEAVEMFEKAIKYFELFTGIEKEDIDIRLKLVKLYEKTGRLTEANEIKEDAKILGKLKAAGMSSARPQELENSPAKPTRKSQTKLPRSNALSSGESSELPHTSEHHIIGSFLHDTEHSPDEEPMEPPSKPSRIAKLARVARRPRSETLTGKIDRKTVHDKNVSVIFPRMKELLPSMRQEDEDATAEWIEGGKSLLSIWSDTRIFFHKDKRYRHMDVNAGSPIERSSIMDQSPNSSIAQGTTSSPSQHELFRLTGSLHGVHLADWLNVFCELSICLARQGDKTTSYLTITTASQSSVFYASSLASKQIQISYLIAALILEDEETLCNIPRWYAKHAPFTTDPYRLYALLARLYPHPNFHYNNGPAQKYFLRQVRATDFAMLNPAQRKIFSEAANEPEAKDHNPHHLTSLDPALLMLYGNLLAAAGTYNFALHYYLRAFSILPSHPILALCISTTYAQHAMKRQNDNRHYHVLQAVAFMQLYTTNRARQAQALSPVVRAHYAVEIDYNQGRLWQLLGLAHLAVECYERCLAFEIPEVEDADAFVEPGFQGEAAYALQQILGIGGDGAGARALAEKFLVF